MKRRICRLALLILGFASVAFTAKARWVQLGDTIDVDAYSVGLTHIAFGPTNEPYVFYQRKHGYGYDDVVRRFNGSTWEQLGEPGIYNGNSSFGFAVDKDGTPYIATDSSRIGSGLIVIKYDGNAWVRVGDTRRFIRDVSARNAGISIAFDSAGIPCVAYSPGLIIRYNGLNWDQISGAGISDLGSRELKSDPTGNLYISTALGVFAHRADTTWVLEDTSGLGDISNRVLLFTIGPSGVHYAEYYNTYSRDSTSMFRYTGNRWVLMGRNFPPTSGLLPVFDAVGTPYALYTDKLRLLRFNGSNWVAVDTGGLGIDASYCSWPANDANGNIYAVAEADTLGKSARVMMYDTHQDALSVPAPLQAGEVSILPIPASQAVFIKNASTAINGLPATITDIHGRTVFEFVLTPTQRVDISKWRSGVYFLHLPNGKVMKMLKD